MGVHGTAQDEVVRLVKRELPAAIQPCFDLEDYVHRNSPDIARLDPFVTEATDYNTFTELHLSNNGFARFAWTTAEGTCGTAVRGVERRPTRARPQQ